MIFRRKPRPTRPTSSVPAGIPSGSGNAGESHPPPPASSGGSSPALIYDGLAGVPDEGYAQRIADKYGNENRKEG